jgi:hypothetical protein
VFVGDKYTKKGSRTSTKLDSTLKRNATDRGERWLMGSAQCESPAVMSIAATVLPDVQPAMIPAGV